MGTVFFSVSSHFDPVTELKVVSNNRVRDNWCNVFPNLILLDTWIIRDDDGLLRIFSYSQLEHLILKLQNEDQGNINSLFTGLRGPKTAYTMRKEYIPTEMLIGRPAFDSPANI